MTILTKLLPALAAIAVLAASAYAQNAKVGPGVTPFVAFKAESPARVIADLPSPLGATTEVHHTPSACGNPEVNPQVRKALGLVCLQPIADPAPASANGLIVIGFLGGFVKGHESNHPEVWFGSYLQERYSPAIHVETYSNHQGRQAMSDVLQRLDTDHDGALTASEKQQASIILYGHSWGASEAVAFARDLERIGVPVLLTVQIDIVPKPGQHATVVPPNVRSAVNLFQSSGPLHGRSEIVAENPEQTEIIGNFHMTYDGKHVDCRNYPLFARRFNKPHHEIENDPRVWKQVAEIIDARVVSAGSPSDRAALR
ncbi:hypothetical protein [Occallatibacter riparius]|uniref:Alpha/beta hydrolase n=1 Tax=Occallatibacter riparius TaxID=1002689 RepID=A0A9J7BQN8_9BACT|nr:hypothetical protein [Occallatibacter riparius]UWZ85188.1 hypothetical protein MOP44_04410 [Occallatibacter riparius]